MKIVILLIASLFLVSCAGGGGMPRGAVAGCGDFAYIGTFTKSQTTMRALWLSDPDAVARMTVEDVVALATAMGCPRQ